MVDNISVDLVAAAKRSDDVADEYTHDDLVDAVGQYRKFLALAVKYRDQPLVPTKQIDMIWHLHMLHPRAYYHDCMALFGQILDHEGVSANAQDEQDVQFASLNVTSALWKKEFGESYMADPASCMADGGCQVRTYAATPASCMASVENTAH